MPQPSARGRRLGERGAESNVRNRRVWLLKDATCGSFVDAAIDFDLERAWCEGHVDQHHHSGEKHQHHRQQHHYCHHQKQCVPQNTECSIAATEPAAMDDTCNIKFKIAVTVVTIIIVISIQIISNPHSNNGSIAAAATIVPPANASAGGKSGGGSSAVNWFGNGIRGEHCALRSESSGSVRCKDTSN